MKWWMWGLLAAIAVAVFLSPFASRWPDGLERVAEQKGFLHYAEGKQSLAAPMPDYAIPGIRSEHLSTAAAGFLGTLATFVLAFSAARLLATRRKAG